MEKRPYAATVKLTGKWLSSGSDPVPGRMLVGAGVVPLHGDAHPARVVRGRPRRGGVARARRPRRQARVGAGARAELAALGLARAP